MDSNGEFENQFPAMSNMEVPDRPSTEDGLNESVASEMTAASSYSAPSTNVDIFYSYQQINNELEHNLKVFGNDNQSLSEKLYCLEQEVEVLREQRNFQQTSLVELQIKSEKLDEMKQSSLEEYAVDKRMHLEYLKKEFATICDNDRVIRDTHDKIKQLLENDKKGFDLFLCEVRQEHVEQLRSHEVYQQTTVSSYLEYCERIKTAIAEEKTVETELESALEICNNKAGMKEKHEFELREKFANLKLIEDEVDVLKIKVQNYKEELDEVLEDNCRINGTLETNRQFYSVEIVKKEEDIERLLREAEISRKELAETETELNEHIGERKYLLEREEVIASQTERILIEIRNLTNQTEALTEVVNKSSEKLKHLQDSALELSDAHQTEKKVADAKSFIFREVASKSLVVKELEMKLDVLKSKCAISNRERDLLKRTEEETKRENEAVKKTLNELMNGHGEIVSDGKLEKLEQHLYELKSVQNQLEEQRSEAQEKLNSAKYEITQLENQNEALDQEWNDVLQMEEQTIEKLSHFEEKRVKLDELKSKISAINDDITEIMSSMEFRMNIDELAVEVGKIRKEVEEKKTAHEEEIENIETAFQKTSLNLQDQMSKQVQASTEELTHRQAKSDSLRSDVSNIQRGINTVKDELSRATERNISIMKDRLKMIEKVLEDYKSLENRANATKHRNSNVARMMETIEVHLDASFRGITDYLQMQPSGDSRPSYFVYRLTLDSFASRFHIMISQEDLRLMDPSYLAELKTAAYCLFGINVPRETNDSNNTLFSISTSE